MVCRVTLELERFDVREADSIAVARAAVAAARPALVFLDVHLGPHASDGFLAELKAAAIPVVIVSGTAELSDYEGRADGLLGKPFDPADLVAAAYRHTVG
jgi:DNA-binding response OmpR family regulator